MAESDPQFQQPISEAAELRKSPRRWGRIAAMVSVPLLLVIGTTWYYFANDHYISTDNAYVQQDKVSVSAEVTGRIIEVAVRENQMVKAGDLLFRIDPEPFRIAIAQADAAIASAQVRVVGLQSELATTGVDISGAREDVAYFEQEYRRQNELMQTGFTTRSRMQSAEHALSDARSRLAEAEASAAEARAALATAPTAPGVNPAVLAALAQKRRAQLDLSRSEVRAPVAGKISQADRLQLGQMMNQGLPALTIVRSGESWVEANFKETDLARMKVGQPVRLEFDAYPDLAAEGRVASIGAGTGSEFSVLPAQNASGNWVKVTQRVPVRVAFTGAPPRQMIAGLSAHVRIDAGE